MTVIQNIKTTSEQVFVQSQSFESQTILEENPKQESAKIELTHEQAQEIVKTLTQLQGGSQQTGVKSTPSQAAATPLPAKPPAPPATKAPMQPLPKPVSSPKPVIVSNSPKSPSPNKPSVPQKHGNATYRLGSDFSKFAPTKPKVNPLMPQPMIFTQGPLLKDPIAAHHPTIKTSASKPGMHAPILLHPTPAAPKASPKQMEHLPSKPQVAVQTSTPKTTPVLSNALPSSSSTNVSKSSYMQWSQLEIKITTVMKQLFDFVSLQTPNNVPMENPVSGQAIDWNKSASQNVVNTMIHQCQQKALKDQVQQTEKEGNRLEQMLQMALNMGNMDLVMLLFSAVESKQAAQITKKLTENLKEAQDKRRSIAAELGNAKDDQKVLSEKNNAMQEVNDLLQLLTSFIKDINDQKNRTVEFSSNFMASESQTSMSIARKG